METITANEDTPGHHPKQAKQILKGEIKKVNFTTVAYNHMEPEDKTEFNQKEATMEREEYLACLFIKHADQQRYRELKKLFVNNGLKGDSSYPKTLEAAVTILKGRKPTDVEQKKRTT